MLPDLIIINLVTARALQYFSVRREKKTTFQTKLEFAQYKWKSYLNHRMKA